MCRELPLMRSLFFFPSESKDNSSIVETLKRSLDFYPFAGRLVRNEDGRFEVDCNDAGVEFVEATVDVSFQDLDKDNFQMKPFFKNLSRTGVEHERSDNLELPFLTVQVTQFLGGGLVIGTTWNHMIADGYSLWHFMNSWAECARGLPISIPPVHTRTALFLPMSLSEANANGLATRINISTDSEMTQHDCSSLKEQPTAESRPTELAQRVFRFNEEITQKLKMMTAKDKKAACTTYEAFCAHLWKHITLAREPEETQLFAIHVFLDVRSRLDPPLPKGYFGNAVIAEFVCATAVELEKESLRSTALRIHETIVSFNDACVRRYLKEYIKADFNFVDYSHFDGRMIDLLKLVVSFSPKFPVHELDFGFGNPVCVRPPVVANDGEMVFYSAGRRGTGSVDVCVGLPAKVLAKLDTDAHFLSC